MKRRKLFIFAALAVLAIPAARAEYPTGGRFTQPPTYYTEVKSASDLTTVVYEQDFLNTAPIRVVENGATAYLINQETDEEVIATAQTAEKAELGSAYLATFTFPLVTSNGEWMVVIPEGTLETVEGNEKNPEFTHTYTLNDPDLAAARLTPVSLIPAAGSKVSQVNSTSGEWSVAFDPEIMEKAGFIKVSITDADPDHLYEGEAFFAQRQVNRRVDTGTITGSDIDYPINDAQAPFTWKWGGNAGSNRMYEGYQYKARFEVRESEYNAGRDGNGEILGIYECIYDGSTASYNYSDARLVSITPQPYENDNNEGYVFTDTNNPYVTFTFDKPVVPNYDLCGVNTGYGTSNPITEATGSDGDKVWRFTIPAGNIVSPAINLFFAFKDPVTGAAVRGNSGREKSTTFTIEYLVEMDLVTLTATPAPDGDPLEEITEIVLSNDKNYVFHAAYCSEPIVMNGQGRALYEFRSDDIVYDSEARTATIVFNPPLNIQGNYTLEIPKKFFILSENPDIEQFETTYSNKAFEGSYSVTGKAGEITYDYNPETIVPADGSEVANLSQVVLYFPGSEYACTSYDPIPFVDESGAEVATGSPELGPTDNSIKIVINDKITTPGKYSATFPREFFYADNGGNAVNFNEEFTASWTVTGGTTEITYDLVPTAIKPAEGIVEKIDAISIDFGQAVEITDGSMLKAVITDKTGAETNVSLMPDWTGEMLEGNAVPAIETEGEYTMTIAKGVVKNFDGSKMNPDLTFVWTVNTVGVQTIILTDGKADIYTVDGRMIARDADLGTVRSLDKGVYIINGMKYIVR